MDNEHLLIIVTIISLLITVIDKVTRLVLKLKDRWKNETD